MKTHRLNLFLALSFTTLIGANITNADYRVATVDVNRVLNESKDAKTKKTELDSISMKAKSKIEAQRDTLKATEEKLKKAGVKSDSKEADKFRQDAKEFGRLVKDTEDDLKKQFLKVNKELTENALTVIRRYAEKNKIDLVLDKGDKVRGPVLYGDSTADITDAVVKDMNG